MNLARRRMASFCQVWILKCSSSIKLARLRVYWACQGCECVNNGGEDLYAYELAAEDIL